MDDNKIRCFMAVAASLSFSKAADNVYKTQSVVSRQISALEDELGIQLFERRARSVTLTPAGHEIYNGFRGLINDYDVMLMKAHALQNGFDGTITVSNTSSQILSEQFIRMISKFEKSYPQIHLHAVSRRPSDARTQLLLNRIDFTYQRQNDFSSYPQIDSFAMESIPNCVVVPCTHPLANADPQTLTLTDFKDDVFFTLPAFEVPTHSKFIRHLAAAEHIEVKLVEVEDFPSLEVALQLGRGITVQNTMHIMSKVPYLRFLPLPCLPNTDFAICWNTENMTPCKQRFIDFIKQNASYRRTIFSE
ncbi:MAG: LysR family transcriptional regulator [Oscillospiraceae bacterium]|nr:LysR family transcriptional regulator [Oscillospiraceae bacterium]